MYILLSIQTFLTKNITKYKVSTSKILSFKHLSFLIFFKVLTTTTTMLQHHQNTTDQSKPKKTLT